MRRLLPYIILLLCSTSLFAQSGLGYVNYRVIKTQNGNGTTWTYNGVTYGGMVDNATEFEGMLDLSNPANTLMSSGEVLSNSSQGLNAGSAPGRPNDYFVVEYTGWFYAELGGQYLFYTYSDDAAQISIGGNVIGGKYSGPGTSATWITLQANTWYPFQFLYHENAGGSYGYLQVYGPRNGYFIPGGANDVYKVSNQAPVYPHTLDVTYNINPNLDKTKFNSWSSYQLSGTVNSSRNLTTNGTINYSSNGNGLDENIYSAGFTPHDIHLGMDETYFSTTYPNMITIADVVKAFTELTNTTNTPETLGGGTYTSDVEYILSDVNEDGVFNFDDTYLLLEHIFGQTSPFINNTVSNSMFMFDGDYVNAVSTNWAQHKPTSKHFTHNLEENNKNKTKSIDVAFLGDINLSHSSPLQNVSVSAKAAPRIFLSAKTQTTSIKLDIVKSNDIINVLVKIPQNTSGIIGTQFKISYDNSRLTYITSEFSNSTIKNFSADRGNYVNIGSFSSDNTITLNEGVVYTLTFKLNSELDSILGLVSIGFKELVTKDGTSVNWIVE